MYNGFMDEVLQGTAIRALIKRKKRYFSDFFKPAFAATFRPDFAR